MMQKLLSRSKFAKLAGVNPSTVTRISETILKPAVVDNRIDAAHPVAVQYLEERARDATRYVPTESAAPGLDPLYEDAVFECQKAERYSISFLQRKLRIGYNRASRIIEIMRLNGLIPEKEAPTIPNKTPEPAAPPPPSPAPIKAPPLRGQAVVREEKKRYDPLETVEIPEDIQAFADLTLRELIEKFGTDTRFVDWLNATQKIEAICEKRLKNAQTEGKLVSRRLIKVGVLDNIEEAHLKMMTDGAKNMARRAKTMAKSKKSVEEIEEYISDQMGSFIRPLKTKIAMAMKKC